VCVRLSLSLSLSANKPRKRDSGRSGVCGNSAAYYFFRGRDEEIHESIERQTGVSPIKKISEPRAKKYLIKNFEFFFAGCQVQINIKTCLVSLPHSSLRVSLYIYNTRQRETQKEMPARSTIAMGGADVMTFVRSTRPGFPKGLKVSVDD
jgi:hypothetical protein